MRYGYDEMWKITLIGCACFLQQRGCEAEVERPAIRDRLVCTWYLSSVGFKKDISVTWNDTTSAPFNDIKYVTLLG
jgi:hypothetical protein